MKLIIPAVLLGGILLTALSGCGGGGGGSSSASSPSPNTTTINGKTVPLTTTASGLQYYDSVVGTGATPMTGQTVSVQYVGTLLNGTQFDASKAPFNFTIGVGQVIKGFDEGVSTMKVGGQRRLVIPGALAYGANPPAGSNIPANATLVFDIQLISAT